MPELVALYKAHILSYIEYRTPAVAHACATTLAPLDAIQARFLREVGLTPEDALLNFRLAPLHSRRDMSILGVIHRAARGQGPSQLRRLFPLQQRLAATASHHFQISNIAADCGQEYMGRSAFGYVAIYNCLPPDIVAPFQVKKFQGMLQKMLVAKASAGEVCWQDAQRRVV